MVGSDFDPPGAADDRTARQPSAAPASPGLHPGGDPRRASSERRCRLLQRYDSDLDAAFERARQHGDLTPLVVTMRRWWFEADTWRNPDAQRTFLARVHQYRREGSP